MVVYVQEMSPWPQMFFTVKRRPYSEAGRRAPANALLDSRRGKRCRSNLEAVPKLRNRFMARAEALESPAGRRRAYA